MRILTKSPTISTNSCMRLDDVMTNFFDMAYNDTLTGIGNRTHLIEFIENNIKMRPNQPFTYIHIDIDNFKIINDLYGHEIGDQLINHIAKALNIYFKTESMTVNRIGGDEFGLIVDGRLSETSYINLIQPLCDSLDLGIEFDNRLIRTTLSAGMAYYPEHAKELKALLQHTDIALLEAKLDGKDGSKLYSPTMKDKILTKSHMDGLLRYAIENNRFELHFQPQVSTSDKSIIGFEALIRLRDEKDQLISPFHFIPIAEESGLILPIGDWILSESISKLIELNEMNGTRYHMSINISTVQMASKDFANVFLTSSMTLALIKAY